MRIAYFIICLTFFWTCKSDKTEVGEQTPVEEKVEIKAEEEAPQVIIYTWVDKLRLREGPDTKSSIVKELSEGEPLVFTGEQTDFTQKISLRGVMYDEPWMKVVTNDEKVGWIFAGGVKFYKPDVDQSSNPYDQCFRLLDIGSERQYEECISKIKESQIKKDANYIRPTSEGYEVMLLDGNKISLKDNDESFKGENVNLDYRCYYPKMGYFVFRMYSTNENQYLLINDKFGSKLPIWGFPKPSPDHSNCIATSYGDEDGRINGFQVFSFTENGLEMVLDKKLDYKPTSVKWITNDELIITMKSGGLTKRMKVSGKDGVWKVD